MGSISLATTQRALLAIVRRQSWSVMMLVLQCASSWPARHYSDVETVIVVLQASRMAIMPVDEEVWTPLCSMLHSRLSTVLLRLLARGTEDA
jgi:hypothetical protein